MIKMFTSDWFFELEKTLRERGLDSDSKSFDEILGNQYKDEVLNLIKADIRKNIKNISDEELKHYCNNIYVFACLKAHNVNDNEVINLLTEYNNNYVKWYMAFYSLFMFWT